MAWYFYGFYHVWNTMVLPWWYDDLEKQQTQGDFTVDLVITTVVGLVDHAYYHGNYNGNSMELPW